MVTKRKVTKRKRKAVKPANDIILTITFDSIDDPTERDVALATIDPTLLVTASNDELTLTGDADHCDEVLQTILTDGYFENVSSHRSAA